MRELATEDGSTVTIYDIKDAPLFSPGCNGGVALVVDCTGSMSGVIDSLRHFLVRYLQLTFADQVQRMTLVYYSDHEQLKNRDRPIRAADTTKDWSLFQGYLQASHRGDGGDGPEAVACAISRARELDPEASIWLVTDAVGHGMDPDRGTDAFPSGCPCEKALELEDVNVVVFGHYSKPRTATIYAAHGAAAVFSTSIEKLNANINGGEE